MLCFSSAFLPGLRHGCVFTRILATNATLCVFIEPSPPVVRIGCVFKGFLLLMQRSVFSESLLHLSYSHDRWKRLYENTERCALVARILVKTQPIRTTGEKGSLKTQSVALVARILWKHSLFARQVKKALWKHRAFALVARILVKTQPCRKPGKKALEKHSIFCN